MEHEPADFSRSTPDASEQDDIDRRLEAMLAIVPPGPGIASTDARIAAADDRARADRAAGRFVPHEQVATWLGTWGTSDYKPMPREWLE